MPFDINFQIFFRATHNEEEQGKSKKKCSLSDGAIFGKCWQTLKFSWTKTVYENRHESQKEHQLLKIQ